MKEIYYHDHHQIIQDGKNQRIKEREEQTNIHRIYEYALNKRICTQHTSIHIQHSALHSTLSSI